MEGKSKRDNSLSTVKRVILQGLTSRRGDPPFTTSRRFLLRIRDSAATAAAVLLVGTLLQSPSENMLAVDRR